MSTNVNRIAFSDFCRRWLKKAARYRQHSLPGAYDRYFTLFVVYNRAYDEAARHLLENPPVLGRQMNWGKLRFSGQRPKSVSAIGDRIKATDGVVAFCGASLRDEVFSDPSIRESIEALFLLSQRQEFYFFFDKETGAPRLDLDRAVLGSARSGDVKPVLEVLYRLRCNLFHGRKEFAEHQMRVLTPANTILNGVVRHLVDKLTNCL